MKTILIAEDDASIRMLLEGLLQSWGYKVIATQNGREATEALGGHVYLVLTDLTMETKHAGAHLLITVKGEYPSMPVIVSSGNFNEVPGMEETLRKQGADLLLHKPYKPDELKAVIEPFFEHSTIGDLSSWFLKTAGEMPSTEYFEAWRSTTYALNQALKEELGPNPLDLPSSTELGPKSFRVLWTLKKLSRAWMKE